MVELGGKDNYSAFDPTPHVLRRKDSHRIHLLCYLCCGFGPLVGGLAHIGNRECDPMQGIEGTDVEEDGRHGWTLRLPTDVATKEGHRA